MSKKLITIRQYAEENNYTVPYVYRLMYKGRGAKGKVKRKLIYEEIAGIKFIPVPDKYI